MGGLTVSVLNSGLSHPGLNLAWVTTVYAVFYGKALNSNRASVHPDVLIAAFHVT